MKVTTLVENLTYKSGLLAEHGLSFYIETESKKILFDTGQSDVFVRNAQALGIDLTEVDAVVISHGHYDHAGGLNTFLRLNQKAKVYLKRAALADKYHGTSRYIGAAVNSSLASGRIVFVDDQLELDRGLFIIPQTPIVNPADTHFKGFLVKKETCLRRTPSRMSFSLLLILPMAFLSSAAARTGASLTWLRRQNQLLRRR